MNIFGKTTLHPLIFYTGKIAVYVTWIVLVLSILGMVNVGNPQNLLLKAFSLSLALLGLILAIISLVNLGRSTRLGLPAEDTRLKTKGLYKYSRNPMYVGFNLFTLSSILYTGNLFILILGVYSLVVHHFIILGEERFLQSRFGENYMAYKTRVRRYF